jgi:hypothetical protein
MMPDLLTAYLYYRGTVSTSRTDTEVRSSYDEGAYDTYMENLTLLSNDALEALFEAYSADDCSDEQWDALMAEMVRRDDFVASSNELEYTLEQWR